MTPQQQEVAEREARLSALAMALPVHGYVVGWEEDGALLCVSSPSSRIELKIRCAPRATDAGRLWFVAEQLAEPTQALAEASGEIMHALVAVKGLMSTRREGP
jgi:hypothetical protein